MCAAYVHPKGAYVTEAVEIIEVSTCVLERAAGIEPASSAWKAEVLPLHNARATFI